MGTHPGSSKKSPFLTFTRTFKSCLQATVRGDSRYRPRRPAVSEARPGKRQVQKAWFCGPSRIKNTNHKPGPQPTGQSHPCVHTTPGKVIGAPSTTPSQNVVAESTVDPDIVPTAFGHCQVPTRAAGWPVSVSHHRGRPGPRHYPSCLNRTRGFLADVPGPTLTPESPTAAEVLFENCICNHVTPFSNHHSFL